MHLRTSARSFLLLALLYLTGACGPQGNLEDNHRPELSLDVGSEETYIVGEDIIQIRLTATDPDDDALTFSIADKPERAEFTTFDRQAVFSWDPIPSDVTMGDPRPLTFIVEDEHGERAERVVRVEIKPGNGRPSFLTSTSELYDTTSEKPVTFEVEVRDDDSRRVEITMPDDEAPSGAMFSQTGKKKGTFTWTPTADQKKSRVHSVTFVADDMDNPPVEHEVTIIFKKRQTSTGPGPGDPKNHQQNCEQKPPVSHQPLGAQHTLEDYQIEATLSEEAAGRFDYAGILWTTKDPFNNSRDIEFNAEPMMMQGRDLTGTIENLQLASGTTKELHYELCAIDEDVPQDSPEAFACSPLDNALYHSFNVYSPDDAECIDDKKSIDKKENAASFSTEKWKHYRLCSEATDIHEINVGSGEIANAYFTFPSGQPIDFQILDSEGNEVGDEVLSVSNCAGLALARVERTRSQPAATYYARVTGEDIPYQTVMVREELGEGGCVKDDLESNDEIDEATILTENGRYENLSVCGKDDRDVFLFEMYAGDEVTADLTFTHADGNLDATIFGPMAEMMLDPSTGGVAAGESMSDGESITYTAEATGDYHLMVYSSDQTPNDYILDFHNRCRDRDAISKESANHTRDDAGVVKLEEYTDLKACADQPDWYQRTGFKGTELSATLSKSLGPNLDDVTLNVYDAMGDKVQESVKVDDQRLVSFEPSENNKQYFFKVEAPSTLNYSITFEQQ